MKCDGLQSMWSLLGLCVGLSLLLSSCASPLVRKGDRAVSDGQWDQAVASYREALKKDPFNSSIQASLDQARARAGAAHYAEGRQALDEHRLADALREFKQALALDPSAQDHHDGMAEALRLKEARDYVEAAGKFTGLGRPEEALAAYEHAVELDPNLTQALAAMQRADKNIDELLEHLNGTFHRLRQSGIDEELFDVIAGFEALSKRKAYRSAE